jgi:hypothetical protein
MVGSREVLAEQLMTVVPANVTGPALLIVRIAPGVPLAVVMDEGVILNTA